MVLGAGKPGQPVLGVVPHVGEVVEGVRHDRRLGSTTARSPGWSCSFEDEIYEAEVLYVEGDFRSYVTAEAQCQQGSLLIVLVGPGDTGELPDIGG
jgi:hypothetical protein